MKRFLLPVLLIISAVLLSSCGGVEAPSDEAVIAAYKAATEASWWFEVGTIGYSAETAEINGEIYNKIRDFESYNEIRDYLLTLFSTELVDAWLENNNYLDYNGELYAKVGERGTDISKGSESYEVIPNGSGKLTLRVVVELLDYGIPNYMDAAGEVIGTETYDIPYEYIDGRWIFTAFPVIR